MHSSMSRLSTAFGYFTSVAMAVAALVACSVFLSPQNPSATIAVRDVKITSARHFLTGKPQELAHVTFDLTADLSSLYNWNTKQVFAFVTAKYPSHDPARIPDSEATIWDAVIPAPNAPWHKNRFVHPSAKATTKKSAKKLTHPAGKSAGHLRLREQRPKYRITDVTGKLAGQTNVTLTLHWAVQPYVGFMTTTNFAPLWQWQGLEGGRSKDFDLPAVGGEFGAGKKAQEKGGEGEGKASPSRTFKKSDFETAKGAEEYRLETGQALRSTSR